MQLEHEFVVPVPVSNAWEVLLDVEKVAPCFPGATLDGVDGDEFTGRVRVKVGPITVTYRGAARFAERDEAARTLLIEANGKEARGSGTATATVRARLNDEGSSTRVTVATDLSVTGRPAQFGRGVMVEVGAKLIGQFSSCLAERLGKEAAATAGEPAGTPATPAAPEGPGTPAGGRPEDTTPVVETSASSPAAATAAPRAPDDSLDLLGAAGVPLLKRVAPVFAAFALIGFAWRWLRARRRQR